MEQIPESMARTLRRIADIQASMNEFGLTLEGQNSPVSGAFADTLARAQRPQTSTDAAPPDVQAMIARAAEKYGLRPNLLRALVKVESGYNPRAVSPKGAQGLMQLMPGTAAALGVSDPFDPEQNIMGGAGYLREQLDRFGGDERLALAAYNAGPGAVLRHNGVPPYPETQGYVDHVLSLAGEDMGF